MEENYGKVLERHQWRIYVIVLGMSVAASLWYMIAGGIGRLPDDEGGSFSRTLSTSFLMHSLWGVGDAKPPSAQCSLSAGALSVLLCSGVSLRTVLYRDHRCMPMSSASCLCSNRPFSFLKGTY